MNNNLKYFALLILPLIFAWSCSDDDDAFEDGGTDTDTDTDTDTAVCPSGMVEVPNMNACIDSNEYTNVRFAEFLAENNGNDCGEAECRRMGEESVHSPFGYAEDFVETETGVFQMTAGVGNYPVVWVTWYGAREACLWEGKTMCDWDVFYAACSNGGLWYFPWGGEIEPGGPSWEGWIAAWEPDHCNDYGGGDVEIGSSPDCNGAYPGMFDLAGNIGEWGGTRNLDEYWFQMGGSHNSIYSADDSSSNAGSGCVFPDYNGVVDTSPTNLPASYMDGTTEIIYAFDDIGFRCCTYLE